MTAAGWTLSWFEGDRTTHPSIPHPSASRGRFLASSGAMCGPVVLLCAPSVTRRLSILFRCSPSLSHTHTHPHTHPLINPPLSLPPLPPPLLPLPPSPSPSPPRVPSDPRVPAPDVTTAAEPSENGVMPLHCAASSGQLRAAEALLDHGADASVRDRDGSLPVDLVPAESSSATAADLEALRRLLSKAARRSGARAAPSGGVPAAASQPEPFARLPREKQLRKVQAWSTWGEGRLRSEAGLNEEAVRCLKQVQRLRGALDVHAVVLELHTDEAFQADCRRPRVLRAVEAIMRDPAELKRFREDGAVMDVVLKLRRFQEAMRLQGNTQSISLRDIILRKASEAEETKRRHNILLYGYDQALDAAVAAASHESAEESRAAVTAIVGRQEAPGGSAPPGNSPAGDDQPEADSPSAGAEGSTQPPEGHPQAADAEERTGFWGTVLGQTLRTLIIAIISYVLAMMFQRNLNAHMTEAPVPRSPPFKHQEL